MHHDDAILFADFLVDWRRELQVLLCTDPEGFIGRRCNSIADKVPKTFPPPQVILAYTHLLTSWSCGGSGAAVIPPILL
jgi:hypothetical protein